MAHDVYSGNASSDAADYRGWLLGHFIQPTIDVRSTDNVEVKWGIHPPGDRKAEWTDGEQRTTMVILVSGRFRLKLTTGEVTLAEQGDYAVWGPGIEHSWEAPEHSVVITVRWIDRATTPAS